MNHIIGYNLRILYHFKNISLLRVFERYNITFDGGGGEFNSTLLLQGLRKREIEKEREIEKSRDENAARLIRPR